MKTKTQWSQLAPLADGTKERAGRGNVYFIEQSWPRPSMPHYRR